MSGKDDGIGGLIVLGAVALVGVALLGGGKKKKVEASPVIEDTPETEEREKSVQCFINNSRWCNENIARCPFCDRPVCSYHTVSCHGGEIWGCSDCRHLVPEYCGSCI